MSEQENTHSRPPVPDCMIEGCPNPEKTRGLCGTCYATAAKQVKLGTVYQTSDGAQVTVTWEWLEAQGLAKPTRKLQPKPVGLFAAQIGAKMVALGAEVVQLPPPAAIPAPYVPAQAAHASANGPGPPAAQSCPPPTQRQQQSTLVPVDPNTGLPYVAPPVPASPLPQFVPPIGLPDASPGVAPPAPAPVQQPVAPVASPAPLPWQQ